MKLLEDGRRFNQELGNHLSVKDTIAFVGRKMETTCTGVASFGDDNRWRAIQWQDTEMGDGTLPEYTAIFPGARVNMPVVANHGEIYISPALLDLLRLELLDKYTHLQAGTIEERKPKFDAIVRIDREVYAPGETVTVTVKLNRVESGEPVSGARVQGKITWLQELPGNAEPMKLSKLPKVKFSKSKDAPGEYKAELQAPQEEGYYELETRVKPPRGDELILQDLFAVEAFN
jgi:hypothetical protein